ncbi:murein L,D-transpeptidase catalytic domain family protein [Vibrio astriarenae]|uniref:murein L,D-transpeptidase catalytic domain family protein n=1 Tax=Vibrio astriarenae TaxID=1481923 RepID=UPI003735EC0B
MNFILKLIFISIWILPLASWAGLAAQEEEQEYPSDQVIEDSFQHLGLEGLLSIDVFRDAYRAFYETQDRKKSLLTIIDYSRPSTEKRFFVVDIESRQLKYHTYVSHGVNSGGKRAERFSNVVNSRKTSLGTFLTDDTYYGGNGYSLRLDGLTPGKNDKARERYIVVHGANYATESFIRQNGYLGRSWGCPALPPELARDIIDLIKEGSVIYAAA